MRLARGTTWAIMGFILFLLAAPALLFLSAGTLAWPMAWAYVALGLLATLGSRLVVLRRNPDTLSERARFISAPGVKSWDRRLSPIVGLLGPLALAVAAGLDHRFGWAGVVPPAGQYAAGLLVAGGYGLGVWAMIVNRYFSAVARKQEDRGQQVVTAGPYRAVRHPAYAGGVLAALAAPFMLNALLALLPALLLVAAIVVRTALEDRMLVEELEGYADYAKRTRSRLVPGLW